MLHGHERSANADDRVLGEGEHVVGRVLRVTGRHLDADFAYRSRLKAGFAQLLEQTVPVRNPRRLDLHGFAFAHGFGLPGGMQMETRSSPVAMSGAGSGSPGDATR